MTTRQAERARARGLRRARSGLAGLLRPVWRAVCSRDADGAGGRTDARVLPRPGRPGVSRGVPWAAAALRRTSHAALRGPAAGRGGRRRAHLPQARGSDPHRRAQDQQRAGAGAAGPSHGQAPHRRRDGRGAARRGDRDGVRAAGPCVRRLHGRRGHGAAGAQRAADAAARRHRAAGGRRQPHAEGRDQRSDARLGGDRRPTRTICWAACWGRIRIR